MAYNPSFYNPYAPQQFQPSMQNMNWSYQPTVTQPPVQPQRQQSAPVIYMVPVKGIPEIREYKEQQGAEPPLFLLENVNAFIKKEFDEQGGEKLRAFRFDEIPLSDIMPAETSYVTKKDFENFANKVMEALNGERSIESKPETESIA